MKKIKLSAIFLLVVMFAKSQTYIQSTGTSPGSVALIHDGSINARGGLISGKTLTVYSSEAGNTHKRFTINTLDGDNTFIYNYDEVAETFHTINLGGANSLFSGVTILGNGKVGIGIDNPIAGFHSHEPTVLGSSIGSYQLLSAVSGRSSNWFYNNLWLIRDDDSNQSWSTARLHDGISIDNSFLAPGTDTRTWWERDPYHNIQSWGNAGSTYMTLSGGNLGLGTTDPSGKLDVIGSGKFRPSSSGQTPDNVTGLFVENNGSSNSWYVFQTASVGGGKSFSVTNAGNVGIGTTTPDSKLTVDGNVKCEEVKVEIIPGSPPDYVFRQSMSITCMVP